MATLWRWWTWLWPLTPYKQNRRKWLWVVLAPLRVAGCLVLFMPLVGGVALTWNVANFLWTVLIVIPYLLVLRALDWLRSVGRRVRALARKPVERA